MEPRELIAVGGGTSQRSVGGVDEGWLRLKEVEERILEFVNRIGDLMVQEVLEGVSEPFSDNRVWVGNQEAVFDAKRPLRFRQSPWPSPRHRRSLKKGPFAPTALPGFLTTTSPSATPNGPNASPHGVPVVLHACTPSGLRVLPIVYSFRHAVVITPVGPPGIVAQYR